MKRSPEQLHRDAIRIWQAGVNAVRSDRLVRQAFRTEGSALIFGDEECVELDSIDRIVVVGAGKAGSGMAATVEEILGPRLAKEKRLTGWVNVPEDCVHPTNHIRLHPARAAGVNEPSPAGVEGSLKILRLVESLSADDLCLVLLSGGGSALMPAPAEGVTLDDKLAVTRHLSAAGAKIEELNTVRKQLSRIKGGGLLEACRAGRLVSLIISDVLGDPLDVIASGPTVADSSTPQEALDVLRRFDARNTGISPAVFEYLERRADQRSAKPVIATRHVRNVIIGNNATAIDAAGAEAERLGYSHAMISAEKSEGQAERVGRHLGEMAIKMRHDAGPDCLISGGEPVVTLVDPAKRGRGGRNQQLVLAALVQLIDDGANGVALLSGGTDGEDGPTDAAGAVLTEGVLSAAKTMGLNPADFLARNDAYSFFEPLDALIKTGPTHTNVCDVRVVVVDRIER
jgi:glycerate 2-kinase